MVEGLQPRDESGMRSEREKARLMKLMDQDNIKA